jgi:hypothetical protein
MCLEGKKDNIFLGTDGPTRSTTARDANTRAGTGKPATICVDEHTIRGPAMGRGGDWDRFAPGEHVRTNIVKPVTQLPPVDGAWHRNTHWELEATAKNKGRYNTTYWKTICEPTLERDQLRK